MKETGSKINVLFIIVQMKMGGSEHLVLDLVRKLDRSQFAPHVAWFYEENPLQQFVDLDVPLYYVPKVKRFDLSTMRALARIIKDNQIAVVNAHHFLSAIYAFYGCKLANRKGLIYTEHSTWEIDAISRKWVITARILFQYIDGVIGISDTVTNRLKGTFHLQNKPAYTIVNGVDCSVFSLAEEKDQAKFRYGFPAKTIVIGMVANLKKNKNHIFLLKAFRNLRQTHSNIRLVLIGQAFQNDPENSEAELLQFIAAEGLNDSVLLLGGRSDVPDLLKAMDIFCLTSYREGLPISMIEAMASGLPVVGTNVDGIREVIKPSENGFLIELNDEVQLTRSLQILLEEPALREDFGNRSRELAYEQYAFENCVQEYESIFLSSSQIGK